MTKTLFFFFLIFAGVCSAADWTVYTKSNSEIPAQRLSSIVIDDAGNKWIGSEQGLILFDGTDWTLTTTNDSLAGSAVNDLFLDQSLSRLWVATGNGVSVFNISDASSPQFITNYRTNSSDLVDNYVMSLAVTGPASWMGTTNGLSILAGEDWETLTKFDWLPHNVIKAMAAHAGGWNYVSTEGGGVARIKYDEVDGISSASPLTSAWSGIPSDTVLSVFVAQDGRRWFGTAYGAASHFGDETRANWTVFTKQEGLIDNRVFSIAQDSSHAMWFGTAKGTSRLSGDQWTNWDISTLPGDSIYDITCAADGSVWFATNNGLAHYSNPSTAITQRSFNDSNQEDQLILYPNPFNTGVTIRLTLAISQRLKISIYNVNGRIVQNLKDANNISGNVSVYWDGKNSSGMVMPSGIYFMQVLIGQKQFKKKLILLK